MDDAHSTYLNRIAQMASPQAYHSQVKLIQGSEKFDYLPSGNARVVSFPGYTIMTPPQIDDAINAQFYLRLHDYQRQLLALEVDQPLFVPLSLSSFHLTLADLIAGVAYKNACDRDADYDAKLHACIRTIFHEYQQQYAPSQIPIKWHLHSLMVMPKAIGVALVPVDFNDYEPIINFRRWIYQNPQLSALDVAQRYHFTAHITLGYFLSRPTELNCDRLADKLIDLNQSWLNTAPEFVINRAELRRFDDMTCFSRCSNWVTLEFGLGNP